jgi:lipopolysaccharide export LptBFGC system permease protein LptF
MIPTAYVNYVGPILTLAAGMFAMTTLNRQNELTPLKAAGVSVYRCMLPIFLIAAALAGGTFYLKDQVLPSFKEEIRAALALSRSKALNPMPYYDQEHACLIRVSEYSTTAKIARRVEVSELHPNGKPKQVICADQMVWTAESDDRPDEGKWIPARGLDPALGRKRPAPRQRERVEDGRVSLALPANGAAQLPEARGP